MQILRRAAVTLIYGTGAAIAAALSTLVLLQADAVPFPDAMLPMELHELASCWLALGFFPMTAATILFRHWHRPRRKPEAALIWVPAAVCLGFLLFWTAVLITGM